MHLREDANKNQTPLSCGNFRKQGGGVIPCQQLKYVFFLGKKDETSKCVFGRMTSF